MYLSSHIDIRCTLVVTTPALENIFLNIVPTGWWLRWWVVKTYCYVRVAICSVYYCSLIPVLLEILLLVVCMLAFHTSKNEIDVFSSLFFQCFSLKLSVGWLPWSYTVVQICFWYPRVKHIRRYLLTHYPSTYHLNKVKEVNPTCYLFLAVLITLCYV